MPQTSAEPICRIFCVLIDAPRSITATSSSVLALKLIPAIQTAEGVDRLRIKVLSKIANTSASSHALPNMSTSIALQRSRRQSQAM